MSTLYIRDVPESVSATLKQRAAEAGLSLSGYVNVELSRLAETPTNASLLERMRSLPRPGAPGRVDIVKALRDERG